MKERKELVNRVRRIASIDIGTNSILCLIADLDTKDSLQVIYDKAIVVRLGQGVDKHRRFHPDALLRAQAALKEFRAEMDQRGVEEVRAVATSAARDVSNGHELIEMGSDLHIPIKIIDGDEEARLTLKGVLGGKIAQPPFVIIDIGGGSTEFIFYDGEKGKTQLLSLDIGSVRLTENWITGHPVPDDEMDRLEKSIESFLNQHLDKIKVQKDVDIVAVAGTATTLASAIQKTPYQRDLVEGFRVEAQELRKVIEEIRKRDLMQRQREFFLEPKRADVIVAGGVLLLKILNLYHAKGCKVSTLGARYGLIHDE